MSVGLFSLGMIALPHLVSLKCVDTLALPWRHVPVLPQVGACHSTALQVFLDTPFLILLFFSVLSSFLFLKFPLFPFSFSSALLSSFLP